MNGFSNSFAALLSWSAEGLQLAVWAGASAGLLATFVLAVNIFARRWLSARQMGILWGIVLFRLLIPVVPSSSISLQNLLPSMIIGEREPRGVDRDSFTIPSYRAAPDAQPHGDTEVVLANPVPATPDAAALVDNLAMLLPLIWVAGAGVCLLTTAIAHWRFSQRLKRAEVLDDSRLCALWNSCRQRAEVSRNVPIMLFDGIEQPAVTGMLCPKLLLPAHIRELDEQQLRMVMLHELAHVRRWHIAANWLLLLIRAIHWWNPVFWVAAARFRSLREQACDAFAIQRIEGACTHRYGELLLALAERQSSALSWSVMLPASILGFLPALLRKQAMRNRIKALRGAVVKRSGWHAIAVAILVSIAAACGLTDAGSAQTPPKRVPDWLPQAMHDWNAWGPVAEIDLGPLVTRTFDVAAVLERIAADEGSVAAAELQLKGALVNTLTGMESPLPRSSGKEMVGYYEPVSNPLDLSDAQLTDDRSSADQRVILDGHTLTVTASADVHAGIVRCLKAWEQSGLAQICIETRFVTDERDIASACGISWRYLEAVAADQAETSPAIGGHGMPVVRAKTVTEDYLPIAVSNLRPEQASALLDRAQNGREANMLQAPKITLFTGQQAKVYDITQTPFVVGIREDNTGRPYGKVAMVDEGIKLTLRAIQSADDTKVKLEAGIELSDIREVGTASTVFRGEPTTIQTPRVKRCRIDVFSDVPDGESLLIGCMPSYEQKRFFYVLLTVRKLGIAD